MRVPRIFLPVLVWGALIFALPASAGERIKIWVTLRDKGPAVSATGRAYEDAPVHAPYLTRLREAGVEIATVLKWQNRASGWVDRDSLGAVAGLSCVRDAEEMLRKAAESALPAPVDAPPAKRSVVAKAGKISAQDFGGFQDLFTAVGLAELRDTVAARGLRPGEGMRIAVMDGAFLLGHRAFDSLFARGAIVDQWDFVDNDPASVSRTLGASHGASVLSQIVGDLPGVLQGAAPRARVLLYRTEDDPNEGYVEEDNLAAALERAVDSGAQVVSISLNYRYDFDAQPEVAYSAMNGRTRPASLAALGAARRGVIVVNSIGNEGALRNGQPTVASPSDADSILTVGSANAAGDRCSYSSTGPTSDGRIKPELSSLGCSMPVANPATATGVSNQSGTSFAAPVVAGVAALLRQLHPDSVGVSGQRVRLALMSTASHFASPDNLTGNGMLRAGAAHRFLLPQPVIRVLVWRDGQRAEVSWVNVDPAGARVWDLIGRSRRVQGGWTPEGNVLIQTSARMAPGAYILKIPARSQDTTP